MNSYLVRSDWKTILKINFSDIFFILFYCSAFYLIGVFFEEGASATRVVTFKGLFTEPAVDWPLTQIYIGHLYGKLYALAPKIPWYGIIDYTLVFSAIVLFYLILKRQKGLFVVVLFAVISIDDIVMFSFTRSAMLVIGASFIALILIIEKYYRKEFSKSAFSILLITLSCLIMLGFLNRPQAFAYIFCLTLFFLFFYKIISNYKLKNLLPFFWLALPLIVVSIISSFYFVNASDDLKESQKLAPKFYSIFGGKFHDELGDLSKGDSLALLMLKGNFVNDRNVFNAEFTDRVTQNSPKEYFSFQKIVNPQLAKRTWSKYSDFYINYHLHDLIIVLLVVVFLLYIVVKYKSKKAMLILLYLIGCLLSLVIITMIVKMETRISSPVFLFTFVSVILLIKQSGIHFYFSTSIKVIVCLGLVILTYFVATTLIKAQNRYQQFALENMIITDALETNFSNHTFIVSNPAIRIFNRPVFNEFIYTGTNTFKTYEGEAIIYMPSMQKMIRDYCGSLEMEDFFDTMFQQNNSTIYIADAEWLKLVTAYMKHFYHKEYVFTEVPDKTDLMKSVNTNLKFYKPEGVKRVIEE